MPSSKRVLDRIREQRRQVVSGFLWLFFGVLTFSYVVNAVMVGSEFFRVAALLPNLAILLLVAWAIALNNSGRTRLAVSIGGGLILVSAAVTPLVVGLEAGEAALILFFIPLVISGLLLDRKALGISTAVALCTVLVAPLLHRPATAIDGVLSDQWSLAIQYSLVFIVLAFLLDRFGLRFQRTLGEALLEQSQAEADLLAEKGFSDAIIESVPGVFFVRDRSGKYVRWNRRFQEVTGYTADELADMEPLGLFDDETKPVAESRIREVFEDGSASADLNLVSKRGEKSPYFLSATRVVRDGKEFLVGSGVDRSELGRAQAHIESLNLALQERVERLTALREIDRAIIGSLDIDLTLGVMLDQVTSKLHVAAARILLYDDVEQVLRFGASKGLVSTGTRGLRVRLGEGPSGTVGREREMLSVEGAAEIASSFESIKRSGQQGLVAYRGVPLVAKGQLQGVLEVFHDEPLPASDDWNDFLDALAVQAAIALSNARLFEDLERSNIELRLAYDTTIEGWSRALDLKDEETEGHSRRVTELAVQLAARLGLKGEDLVHVRRGALLHDIGKMGVPDRILLKPGKLDPDEWEVMKRHTTLAHDLLNGIAFLRPALAIPHAHHEKWDGTGYPRGIAGEEIPIAARLFAVVDVFDALTSDRPYRGAWSHERALGYLREQAGTHFDPRVVKVFLEMIGERTRNDPADRMTRQRPAAGRDPHKTGS